MEAFLLPVASSSADSSSSSLSQAACSVCVGDADGDAGGGSVEADNSAFFLDFSWAGGLVGAFDLVSPTCLLDGAVAWNFWGWAFIIMALSMSNSGYTLSEDGS